MTTHAKRVLLVADGGPDGPFEAEVEYVGTHFCAGLKLYGNGHMTSEVYAYTGYCPRQRVMFARWEKTRKELNHEHPCL